MHKIASRLLLLSLCAAAVGCGGVGAPYRGETEFIGTYHRGGWSTGAEQGTMTLTVTQRAELLGSFTNTNGGFGTITGNIARDGAFSANFNYSDGRGSARVEGALSKVQVEVQDGDETKTYPGLAGDATYRLGNQTLPFTFTVY